MDENDTGTDPNNPDTDQDGCTDGEELGPDEVLGGRRDPNNFWDFYDPDRNKAVALGDYQAILRHFGTVGDPTLTKEDITGPEPPNGTYWVLADRGGQMPGGDPWDELPADGQIALGDIMSLLRQYGHTCAPAP